MNNIEQDINLELKSPCINLCKMDSENLYCLGCHRTLEEIASWGSLSNFDKQDILSDLKKR